MLSFPYHPDWYFFPLLAIWQVLLPLFLIELMRKSLPFPEVFAKLPKPMLEGGLMMLLIIGQGIVYLANLGILYPR